MIKKAEFLRKKKVKDTVWSDTKCYNGVRSSWAHFSLNDFTKPSLTKSTVNIIDYQAHIGDIMKFKANVYRGEFICRNSLF